MDKRPKANTGKHLRRPKRIQFLKFGAKIRLGNLKRNRNRENDGVSRGFFLFRFLPDFADFFKFDEIGQLLGAEKVFFPGDQGFQRRKSLYHKTSPTLILHVPPGFDRRPAAVG
jgi:hypothetical protein